MNKRFSIAMALILGLFLAACTQDGAQEDAVIAEVPNEVVLKLQSMGFNVNDYAVWETDGGYIVENDIFISYGDLEGDVSFGRKGITDEHYSTTNLVTGLPRTITVYLPTGGRRGFSAGEEAALNLAISRYNAENLLITFQRVSSANGADIEFRRLSRRDERRGVLGSAGFPTNGGDPFGEIRMSGILESSFGLSTGGIATIFAHEMGHCIGLRHTDYMDRSFSCGGSPTNEGTAGVGANYIPGTPTGPENGSYMLSCTDGSDRPFTNGDQTALSTLY